MQPPAPLNEPAPVLIVDDRAEDRLLYTTLLAGLPCTAIAVTSGEQALKVLTERTVAAIVLDVRMSGMDGFTTARTIRANPLMRHTPILFVTGAEMELEGWLAGYETGAVDFLLKPVNPVIFRSKLSCFIDLYNLSQRVIALQSQQLDELRRADVQKDQFLGILSHELRTPLHAIISCGSCLEDGLLGTLTPNQTAYVRRMLDSGEALLSLVNNILDLNQIRAGRFSVEPDRMDLSRVVGEVAGALGPWAESKGLRMSAHLPAGPLWVWADEGRVRQVVSNLVGNAIKFTPTGKAIALRLGQAEGLARIEVEDEGIGIASDDQPHVFEAFWQSDMTATREFEGTGLGLAISYALVQAHGGEIGLRSEAGQGCLFWVQLRVDPPTPRVGEAAPLEHVG